MSRNAKFMRATALNAASSQAGAALAVMASVEGDRPTEQTASFKCGDCSAVFASNEGSQPFCVSCGSHHVNAEAELPPEQLPDDQGDQLSAYVCASCGVYNVLSSANVPTLAGHTHCVACGTVNNLLTAGDGQEDQTLQGQDQQEQQQQQEDQMQQASGDQQQQQGNPFADDQQQQQQQQQQEASGDQQQQQGNPFADDQQQQQEASDQMSVETVPLDDAELLGDPAADSDLPVAEQQVELSMLAAALGNNPAAELKLVRADNSILALLDGQHVATLTKTEAAAHVMFDRPQFAHSIMHHAASRGVTAALADYGFAPMKVRVPMTATFQALVRRGVTKAQAGLEATRSNLNTDLTHSLRIAASALNRGLFRQHANPMKEALIATLSAAGVSNPSRTATSMMASAGDEYARTLLQLANELSTRTPEFRQEIAASLQDMQQPEVAGVEADLEHDKATFSVPAVAKVTASHQHQPVQRAASGMSSIRQIAASVGGSIF